MQKSINPFGTKPRTF